MRQRSAGSAAGQPQDLVQRQRGIDSFGMGSMGKSATAVPDEVPHFRLLVAYLADPAHRNLPERRALDSYLLKKRRRQSRRGGMRT